MTRSWRALLLSALLLWQGSSVWAFHGIAAAADAPTRDAIAASGLPCHDPILTPTDEAQKASAPCADCECCPWPNACKPAPALPVAVTMGHRPPAMPITSSAFDPAPRAAPSPPFRPPITP